MRPDIYNLLAHLDRQEKARWADIVQQPAGEYEQRLAAEAEKVGCSQEDRGEVLAWIGTAGNIEAMFFRIPDPGDLGVVRRMYDRLAETSCPIPYASVNQRGDGIGTWDVFHLSRISYLCHCKRFSGPGSACDA